MSLISTWSTTPNANGTLGATPYYWPEGQAPSTVNDCARQMMATIRTQWNDAVWFNWGYTVTRVSGTSFTVVTASWNTVTLPAGFVANGRIKCFDTTGNVIYGTVQTVSASPTSTLVTFTPDSGSLTATITSVANSIIPPNNTPIPGLNIPTNVITQTMTQIYAADTGAVNAAQISLTPTLSAYVTGELINFKAAHTNTGPMTLQVDALGAKTIKKLGGSTDLAAGDVLIGQIVTVAYDGTNFEMVNPIANVSGGGSGLVVQRVSTQTGAFASGSTIMPLDNTIPQSSEGDQYMTLSITPQDAAHVLVIEVIMQVSANLNSNCSVALFQDSNVNAIAASGAHVAAGTISNTSFRYVMTAGTTSPTTFKIRAGVPTSGSFYFNGTSGAAIWGGVANSGIMITEYTS